MLALFHRFLEMDRPVARRRGEDHDIRERDGLLVAVEAGELPLGRHVHLVAVLLLEVVERAFEAVLEGVGDGDELGAGGVQGLVRRAGAAPARADKSDLERVAALRVGEAAGRERADRGDAGGGDEVAPGDRRDDR